MASICLCIFKSRNSYWTDSNQTKKKPYLNSMLSVYISVGRLARLFLFAIHKKIERPNLMKFFKKLSDIPHKNMDLLPFQFFHRFEMAAVCMT